MIGAIFYRKIQFVDETEALVLRYVSGSAIASFALCFMATAGFFHKTAVLILILLGLILAAIQAADFKTFVRPLFGIFLSFKEHPLLWVLFGLNSLPSLLPPYRWDEMSFHLAYAAQWVKAGGMTLDPTMRYPLNSFNFHILWAAGLMLGSYGAAHLLTWFSGSMAALGIFCFLKRSKVWAPVCYVSALGFYFSPLIQACLNVALVDVPSMLYLLMTVYGIVLCSTYPEIEEFHWAAALTAGMFLGIRTVNFFYLPLLAALIIWVRPKSWTVSFIILMGFGAFWNLKNWIVDQDFVWPILRTLLKRPGLFWSLNDVKAITTQSMHVRFSGISLFTLTFPFRMVFHSPGVPIDILLNGFMLFFPVGFLVLILFDKNNKAALILLIVCSYATLFWIFTTLDEFRYAHFVVLAAVVAGLGVGLVCEALGNFLSSRSARIILICFLAFLFIGPTKNAFSFYKNNFNKAIPSSNVIYEEQLDPSLVRILETLKRLNVGKNLYVAGYTHFKYYWNEAGYHVTGDWINTYRYEDFKESVSQKHLWLFLKSTGSDAAVVRPEILQDIGLSHEGLLSAVRMDPRLRILAQDSSAILIGFRK